MRCKKRLFVALSMSVVFFCIGLYCIRTTDAPPDALTVRLCKDSAGIRCYNPIDTLLIGKNLPLVMSINRYRAVDSIAFTAEKDNGEVIAAGGVKGPFENSLVIGTPLYIDTMYTPGIFLTVAIAAFIRDSLAGPFIYRFLVHGIKPVFMNNGFIIPVNEPVVSGEFKLFIHAEGSPPIQYAWFRNDIQVPAASADTLTIVKLSEMDTLAQYRCIASNRYFGDDSSKRFLMKQVTFLHRPQADSTLVASPPYPVVNSSFSLTAAAHKGTPPLVFVWFFNDMPVDTMVNIDVLYFKSFKQRDTGTYYCRIQNRYGTFVTGKRLIAIGPNPVIFPKNIDQDPSVPFLGYPVKLFAKIQCPVAYGSQWYKNDTLVQDSATYDTLKFDAVKNTDAGRYRLVVSNGFGSDTTEPYTLKISADNPAQLMDKAVYIAGKTQLNETCKLYVSGVRGTPPIAYRWHKSGAGQPVGSNDTLDLSPLRFIDSGMYRCIVSNRFGADSSGIRHLTVTNTDPPVIVDKQILTEPAAPPAFGRPYALFVKAQGMLLEYQWLKNNAILSSANFSAKKDSIRFITFSITDEAVYRCIVSNPGGTDTSLNYTPIHQNQAPKWTRGSYDATVEEGKQYRFSLTDSCKDPDNDTLRFQVVSAIAHEITGTVLTVSPNFTDAGQHQVPMSASDGMATATVPLLLTVRNVNRPPAFQAHLPDASYETAEGKVLKFAFSAIDPDKDSVQYGYSIPPAGASIDVMLRTFAWIPGAGTAGDYTITLTATDGNPGGSATITVAVRVTAAAPPPPTLVSPADGAADISLRPLFTWTASAGADHYIVQYGTVTAAVKTTEYSPMNGLSQKTAYTWRVKALNSVGESDWSESRSFTTGAVPLKPTLIAPVNNAGGTDLKPAFSWTIFNAMSCTLKILHRDSVVQAIPLDGITDTYTVTTPLSSNSTYQWNVRASNEMGPGDVSETWSFTTRALLVPRLFLPFNNARSISSTPRFDWFGTSDAIKYTLRITTADGSLVVTRDVADRTSYTVAAGEKLLHDTRYRWQVKAHYDIGESGYSEARSFTTR